MLATLFIAIGRLCGGKVNADDLFAVPDVGQTVVRIIIILDQFRSHSGPLRANRRE